MSLIDDLREFANLPVRVQAHAISSLPTLIGLEGGVGLRLLRSSPRLAYCFAHLAIAERFLKSVGRSADLVGFGTEVASDFDRLNSVIRLERSSGYAPGVGLNSAQLIVYSLIRSVRPDLVIETGVASGVSSYFILRALEANRNGRLISVDLPNLTSKEGYVNQDGVVDPVYTPPERGPGWMVPDRLRGRWQLLLGRSMEVLPKLSVRPDLFSHDSDHSYKNMMDEFSWARRSGAPVILSDDIRWNTAWLDFVRSGGIPHAEIANLGIGLAGFAQVGTSHHESSRSEGGTR